LNVTVENVTACRKKLTIEVPVDEVAREWKGVLTEFQKFAQIPGFRVGRAPIPILERKFQKEIGEEVQRKLIPQFFREAVAKEKLKVVSLPSVEEIKFARNEPLYFMATVDVTPEFQLPTYKGLRVKKKKVEMKPDELENALKLLADQQASFADVTGRGLELGDFAVISYSGVCEGKPIAEITPAAKPLSENKQFWLLMAMDSFLPGFCDSLVGAKIGEKKQALVDFPNDFQIKELAGKKATYFVDILGIKEKNIPPFDDAFATDFKAANMAELKMRIQENMLKEREQRNDGDVQNQIVEQLLKTTSFELPESVVNDETRNTLVDIVRENRMRGLEDDTIREKSREILDFAQQNAKDKVRASFILLRIAEEEKVEVKEEDLQERIQTAAQRAGKPLKEFTQQLRDSGNIEALREQLLIRHTLDLLVSHAMVEIE